MKKLTLTLITLSLLGLGNQALGARKGDLRISRITTPGGFKTNPQGQFRGRVMVTVHNNSQTVPIKQQVRVRVRIFRDGKTIDEGQGFISGIGPNASQSVYVNNLFAGTSPGTISIQAYADPLNQIAETNEGNNVKSIKYTLKGAGPPGGGTGYPLTVKIYQQGTWQGGSAQWISGAQVRIYKNNNQVAQGTTNNSGQVSFSSIPKGMVKINVTKAGCPTINQNYMKGSYAQNKNIAVNCN